MTCFGIRGAFQHCDVNIGWYPYRTKVDRVKVWSKPGCGVERDVLSHHTPSGRWLPSTLGRQSVLNPGCSDHPAPRLAVAGPDGNSYVWCYAVDGGETGWVLASAIEPYPSPKATVNGPAREDFEVGRGHAVRGAKNGCGKVVIGRRPHFRVKVRDAHLRASGHGSGLHYLHRGDLVIVLIKDGPQGFHFVEVLSAAHDGSARRGDRGWVSIQSLERVK